MTTIEPEAPRGEPERWLPVPGWETYQVSSLGRVRNRAGHVMKGRPITRGYLRVHLWKNARRTEFYIHHLVLMAFVGPRPVGGVTRHANGVTDDNRLANLQWGTQSDNIRDQVAHGTHPEASKTTCPRGHLLAMPNLFPGDVRRGYRRCRACTRARNVAHASRKPFLAAAADAKYAAIMSEATP